jgi:hypothetical protein
MSLGWGSRLGEVFGWREMVRPKPLVQLTTCGMIREKCKVALRS